MVSAVAATSLAATVLRPPSSSTPAPAPVVPVPPPFTPTVGDAGLVEARGAGDERNAVLVDGDDNVVCCAKLKG